MAPSIRRATRDDLVAITDIYNDAVAKTTATFDTEPKSLVERGAWLSNHGARHPVFVAETAPGKVDGWASLGAWSDRKAYDDTAEVSIYVRAETRGQGLGRALLAALLAHARKHGFHTLIARIADANEVSLRLHESQGFVKIGVMREVGRKFGRLLDVHLYQVILN
jgi:L-amino acid N-acyltransferase YncA